MTVMDLVSAPWSAVALSFIGLLTSVGTALVAFGGSMTKLKRNFRPDVRRRRPRQELVPVKWRGRSFDFARINEEGFEGKEGHDGLTNMDSMRL